MDVENVFGQLRVDPDDAPAFAYRLWAIQGRHNFDCSWVVGVEGEPEMVGHRRRRDSRRAKKKKWTTAVDSPTAAVATMGVPVDPSIGRQVVDMPPGCTVPGGGGGGRWTPHA